MSPSTTTWKPPSTAADALVAEATSKIVVVDDMAAETASSVVNSFVDEGSNSASSATGKMTSAISAGSRLSSAMLTSKLPDSRNGMESDACGALGVESV